MGGKTEIGRDSKTINIAKIYKRWEIMESHDQPRPEETWNIEIIYHMREINGSVEIYSTREGIEK